MSRSTVMLEHHLKKLKLPSMLREYRKAAETCRSDRSDYSGYLLRLAERELLDREARAKERRVRFSSVTGLVTHLLELREQRYVQRLHQQLERSDLLVLDELGYVPFSKAGAELLFEVISRAYERTSLIVTTNLPFEQWIEVMGSERMTGALLDRLTHRVHIIEANGESYRLAESRRRQKRRHKRAPQK